MLRFADDIGIIAQDEINLKKKTVESVDDILKSSYKMKINRKKNGRLCRVTAASFYMNTSLRAERNKLNPFMNTFIY